MLIVLLSDIVNESNHSKCMSLSNHKYVTPPTLLNLQPNECSEEFDYCPFAAKLDRCDGSCNTHNDLSNKVWVPNKTEDSNRSVFNMIAGINESKTLIDHISCEFKCKFDGRKFNSDQW